MKILVADDNPINRLLIQCSLEKEHHIDLAADGLEAFNKAICMPYDLILMDLSMPVLDGAQAILKIREWEKSQRTCTPILVFTTIINSGERKRCIAYGATRYLHKPMRPRLLKEIINSYQKDKVK